MPWETKDVTKMQMFLVKAHEINRQEEFKKHTSQTTEPEVSRGELDKLWEEKIKKAQEKYSNKQKTQEEILEDARKRLIKKIEEK